TELALALADSDPAQAAQLLAAADAEYAARGIVRPPAEAARFAALRDRLAAGVDAGGHARALAAGAALSLSEAVRLGALPAPTAISSRPSGPASNARTTWGLTRMTSHWRTSRGSPSSSTRPEPETTT